jgi:hypothetical protein
MRDPSGVVSTLLAAHHPGESGHADQQTGELIGSLPPVLAVAEIAALLSHETHPLGCR